MARVTVEDCLRQVNSRFALVHLAVRRVLQLRRGFPPLVEAPKNKEVVRALREIAAGKVTFENILELESGPNFIGVVEPAEVAIGKTEVVPASKKQKTTESPATTKDVQEEKTEPQVSEEDNSN